ncbi:MAG TPA: FAD:protein FMN transferase [Thermoanaerobaculia bacterium]|jgi:thiamine biosynthesis lipoprotein|nr:FAD:protein FMN transferase [Thermoanaerobaculia bacterium]
MHRPVEQGPILTRIEDYFAGRFVAMASPCSVLIDSDDHDEAAALVEIAANEALRIEHKFSRYRGDNIVHEINHAAGKPVTVDDETAHLLDYANTCWEISEGLFDITSGVLRRIWKFDGGHKVPGKQAVEECLRHVGWPRVTWQDKTLTMPAGMEIDLGGIGKEYAVDRAAALLAARTQSSCVVNFGGDMYVGGLRSDGRTWSVGIDDPARTGKAALYRLDLARAGLATSGDARRFVRWRGKRLGHILNPKTGWPVRGAPSSVTVVASTCLEAGTLSTLALLQGPEARGFLEQQNVQFWIV